MGHEDFETASQLCKNRLGLNDTQVDWIANLHVGVIILAMAAVSLGSAVSTVTGILGVMAGGYLTSGAVKALQAYSSAPVEKAVSDATASSAGTDRSSEAIQAPAKYNFGTYSPIIHI